MEHHHSSNNIDDAPVEFETYLPSIDQRVQQALGERVVKLEEEIVLLEQKLHATRAAREMSSDNLRNFTDNGIQTTELTVTRQKLIDHGYDGYFEPLDSQNFSTNDTDVSRIVARLVATITQSISAERLSIVRLSDYVLTAMTVTGQGWSYDLDPDDISDIVAHFNKQFAKARSAP